MGLEFRDLNDITRSAMISEINMDAAADVIYKSNYLNDIGRELWAGLILDAAKNGSDDDLSHNLRINGCFKSNVERRKPSGGFSMVSVPVTAAQTLAESQFNMYYMRALALRALDEGKSLIVYRARESAKPREESERMIGEPLDPELVLRSLRETRGVEPTIGIPLPNSGITVYLS